MGKSFDRRLAGIGERVKRFRRRKDYCQESFAEALGVSSMTVSRIENGITPMNVLLLLKISEVLEVEVEEILKENEQFSDEA